MGAPSRLKSSPGPHYDPSLKPEIPNPEKFTFGYRRDIAGSSPLVLLIGTPTIVSRLIILKINRWVLVLILKKKSLLLVKFSKSLAGPLERVQIEL